jgi:hypothetical protein
VGVLSDFAPHLGRHLLWQCSACWDIWELLAFNGVTRAEWVQQVVDSTWYNGSRQRLMTFRSRKIDVGGCGQDKVVASYNQDISPDDHGTESSYRTYLTASWQKKRMINLDNAMVGGCTSILIANVRSKDDGKIIALPRIDRRDRDRDRRCLTPLGCPILDREIMDIFAGWVA